MPSSTRSIDSARAAPGRRPHRRIHDRAAAEPPSTGPAPLVPVGRLDHLDALRGIAAVVVVVHHALLAIGAGARTEPWSVFNIVLLGRPAVVLFFVLSGFVLTLHLTSAKPGFLSFAVRRLLRLMPPYGVAIAAAAMLFGLTQPHRPTGLSSWFDAQWSAGLGASDLLRHLAMVAGPRQFPLDHVAWSLVHELRLSLALPLVLSVVRRWGPVVTLVAAAATTLLADAMLARWPALFPAGVHGFRFDAEGLGLSLVLTARFGLAFALGAVLATHGAPVQAAMRRRGAGLLGLTVALALLSCRNETLMALGATLLVAAAAWAPRLAAKFRVGPLLWLGRLSFSLYLVHLPLMLACVYAGPGVGPAWAHLAVGLGLGLPVAAAMAYGVEAPAIRWSRAGARGVSRWARGRVGAERFAAEPRS